MSLFRKAHQCDLRPVAVSYPGASLFTAPVSTAILYRCECSAVQAETVVGRWTLAQVKGEPEPASEVPVA